MKFLILLLCILATATCFVFPRNTDKLQYESSESSEDGDDDSLPVRDADLETTLAKMERSIRVLDGKIDEHNRRSIDVELVKIFKQVRTYFYETMRASDDDYDKKLMARIEEELAQDEEEDAERIEEKKKEEKPKSRQRRQMRGGEHHGIGHGVGPGHHQPGHGIGHGAGPEHRRGHQQGHNYDPYHGRRH